MRHECLLFAGAVIALVGCSGDTTGTAPSVTGEYFSLTLNQHAINMSLMAPSNTIQLTATLQNANGDPLDGGGETTFHATDSSVVVSPSGLVTAQYVTHSGGTEVIAAAQRNGITHADTAFIRVTAAAPAPGVATFSIQPVGGDSAIRAVEDNYRLTVHATDSLGHVFPFNANTTTGSNNFYWLSTSNPTIASYARNQASGFALLDTGHVTFYATAWVYGVSVQDSLYFTVGWPVLGYVYVWNDTTKGSFLTSGWFQPRSQIVSVGGAVVWINGWGGALDVEFDDSTVVDSAKDDDDGIDYTGKGNIHFNAAIDYGYEARSFPVAGIYHFHSPQYPQAVGTIYVLNNP